MLQEEINSLSLPELMDILVTDTLKLLELMNQRDADGITIRNMRTNLQLIQKAIKDKKSNKLRIA